MSLHVGGFGIRSRFQPALNLRSDAKGLVAIAVDSSSLSAAPELRSARL
jgi:hypothetical protein